MYAAVTIYLLEERERAQETKLGSKGGRSRWSGRRRGWYGSTEQRVLYDCGVQGNDSHSQRFIDAIKQARDTIIQGQGWESNDASLVVEMHAIMEMEGSRNTRGGSLAVQSLTASG